MRFCVDVNDGLNIVSTDYVAKAMYEVCMQDDPGESYHLTNPQVLSHGYSIPKVLEIFNIRGLVLVDEMPENMNPLESIYYRTVGKIFTPYMKSESMHFDTSNLENVWKTANLTCPPIDKDNFKILLDYAKKYDFGLTISTPEPSVATVPAQPKEAVVVE